MKTSTVVILAVAGVAVIYLATRSSSSTLSSTAAKQQQNATTLGGFLGTILGTAIVGGSGNVHAPAGAGGGGSATLAGTGISEQEIYNLDYANIDAYDDQGSTDAPVFGIAGLDYPV